MTNRKTKIQLVGGLGNQLFGIALGRFLELEHGITVTYIKANSNGKNSNHGVSLSGQIVFGRVHSEVKCSSILRAQFIFFDWFIASSLTNPNDLMSLTASRVPNFLRGYYQWLTPVEFLRERGLLEIVQNEDSDLRLRKYQEGAFPKDRFAFLHMRFGDYQQFGELQIDRDGYYLAACRILSERVGGKFAVDVFTDDSEAAAEVIRVLETELENLDFRLHDPNSLTPIDTILLMSEFSHAIIANSTFSWWGAQIRKRSGVTLYPSNWGLNWSLAPEIPSDWIPVRF